MPSSDSRFDTFEGEIQQHTINNYDYKHSWVFHDDRLGLKNGNDEILLKFLCEMFHPVVRSEKSASRRTMPRQALCRQYGGVHFRPSRYLVQIDAQCPLIYRMRGVQDFGLSRQNWRSGTVSG